MLLTAVVALLAQIVPAPAADTLSRPARQNPSPMVEHTRAHERVEPRELPGMRMSVEGVLREPVRIFVPERPGNSARHLLIHFHGAEFIPEQAVSETGGDYVLATVHLGAGSGVYEQAFTEPATFDSLLAAVRRSVAVRGVDSAFAGITLSGFSAGHGAIRAILREPRHFAAIDGVLLLDGLHTGYHPPGTVLAEGGTLDTSNLEPFVRLAEAAIRGEKRFLVTHSEIFPGTFASTTETADYLIGALGLRRVPVLAWGPLGMQQLSRVEQGRFAVLGFAGNSAPDHTDHFHGMSRFLAALRRM